MSSSAARKARIGEVFSKKTEGFGKHQRRCFANLRRKAALRLTVNPFGSVEPLPLYRADAAIQRKTLLRLGITISNKLDCSALDFHYLSIR